MANRSKAIRVSLHTPECNKSILDDVKVETFWLDRIMLKINTCSSSVEDKKKILRILEKNI